MSAALFSPYAYDLADIDALERHVDESASVVLVLTRAYFVRVAGGRVAEVLMHGGRDATG